MSGIAIGTKLTVFYTYLYGLKKNGKPDRVGLHRWLMLLLEFRSNVFSFKWLKRALLLMP
jgi:hypothetical protein